MSASAACAALAGARPCLRAPQAWQRAAGGQRGAARPLSASPAEERRCRARVLVASSSAAAAPSFPSPPLPAVASGPPQLLGWEPFDMGQYSIVQELGKGSFGTVLEAVDEDTQQPVAIKMMSKLRPRKTPAQTAKRLQWEAGLLKTMQAHTEHVVKIYGAYEDQMHGYVIMEKLAGGTLMEFIESSGGRLCEGEVQWIAADVLDFIAACHDNDIVFADAKPANFMLDPSGERWKVKAIDMGCSQVVPEGERVPMRSGTPLYIAPEVFQKSCGHESDLWSVGVMLYLMLTGRNPWFDSLEGVSPEDVMNEVLKEEPVVFREEDWIGISQEAKDLVQGMLNKDALMRTTAPEALAHPWFTQQKQQEGLANNVIPLDDSKLGSKKLQAC